jgi:prepilin-type N-terminal cleavage/methylation domain-containing protein
MRTPVSTSPSKSCSGFSLVEILVALSIIATLSIVAYV